MGTVKDVERGRASVVDGADSPSGRLADFGHPKAVARSYHLVVAVRESLGGVSIGNTIRVGIAFNGESDINATEAGLRQLGDVLLFLERSPVFAYDPELYGITEDGALLATLDKTGTIRLPAKSASEVATLLAGSTTLSQLKRQANSGPRVIQVDLDQGVPKRR